MGISDRKAKRDNPHVARFLENPAKKGIVIFIHGFMGSPRQFAGLIDAAQSQGYSTAALLLPGHGGSVGNFAASTFKRWQNHVDSEIERFLENYTEILLVGHSMGGLLAINAAVRFSRYVRGIFLIASPFTITVFSVHAMKTRLKLAFSKRNDPIKVIYLSDSSVPLSLNLLWGVIKPSLEFRKLMRTARKNLPKIEVPVTAVYSSADEVTPIKSLAILKNELNDVPFNQVLLSDSFHAYYTEQEQLIIQQSLKVLLTTLA